MMNTVSILVLLMSLLFSARLHAADFKPYPGAKVDEQATRESNANAIAAKVTNVKSTVYTTPDPFHKVASFYRGMAREFVMPLASGTTGKPKRDEGYDLWEAYFILDGAKDLSASTLWVKVQRPYIGENVRDVTAILVTRKSITGR